MSDQGFLGNGETPGNVFIDQTTYPDTSPIDLTEAKTALEAIRPAQISKGVQEVVNSLEGSTPTQEFLEKVSREITGAAFDGAVAAASKAVSAIDQGFKRYTPEQAALALEAIREADLAERVSALAERSSATAGDRERNQKLTDLRLALAEKAADIRPPAPNMDALTTYQEKALKLHPADALSELRGHQANPQVTVALNDSGHPQHGEFKQTMNILRQVARPALDNESPPLGSQAEANKAARDKRADLFSRYGQRAGDIEVGGGFIRREDIHTRHGGANKPVTSGLEIL